jgi:outer membrane protein
MRIRYQSGWLLRVVVAATAALAVTAAVAADYPTKKAPPPAPAPAPVVASVPSGFFVKAGFLYGINQTSSKLYSQGTIPGSGAQIEVPGVGATVGNVATLGVEAGYFVTPNVSVDVSAGIPMWAKDNSKGTPTLGSPFNPGAPLPPNGTTLAKIMPSFIPLTVLYHFNQFGAFQPYIGGGVAAVFSFQTKDEFNTGVTVDPTVGLVLQGGADVMIDQHWGWSFDVKKVFANVTAHGTGDNLSLIGLPYSAFGQQPVSGTQKTYFQPWVLSTGVVYRF